MQIEVLSLETTAIRGFTHRIRLTHEDLTQATANTAQVIPILSVNAGSYVSDCATKLVTAFKNSADAAFNTTAITVGDGGSANRFLTSTELNENGTEVYYKAGALTSPYVYTTADTIDITFNAMSAKALVDLNAGELIVFLNVAELATA